MSNDREQKPNLDSRRRCDSCAAKRGEPCSFALERIHAMQAELNNSKSGNLQASGGCDWYINSAEHNYSFWNFAKELHGSPVPDKEICQLLLISQSQLREIYNSAIKKLIAQKDEPHMQEFLETVRELARDREAAPTDYLPESFKTDLHENGILSDDKDGDTPYDKELDDLGIKKKKRRKKLNGMGMPIHRSGNKVDLYGLSSNKKGKK